MELDRLRQLAREADNRSRDLQAEIELLSRRAQSELRRLDRARRTVLGDMIGRSIQSIRVMKWRRRWPVMGEAIRVQVRESRDDMAEALCPVIGATVPKGDR